MKDVLRFHHFTTTTTTTTTTVTTTTMLGGVILLSFLGQILYSSEIISQKKNMIQEVRVTLRSTTIISPCKLGSLEDYFPLGRNLLKGNVALEGLMLRRYDKAHSCESSKSSDFFDCTARCVVLKFGMKVPTGQHFAFFCWPRDFLPH